MSETTTLQPAGENVDDHVSYEAQIDRYMAKIQRLQQQMADDREEILQMQTETRALIDDVMTTLNLSQSCGKN